MTITSRLLISVLFLGSALRVHSAVGDRAAAQTPSAHTQQESPFACDRMALSPAERTRQFDELGPMLRAIRHSSPQLRIRALADGYEFEFPSDTKTYGLVAEWANRERVCCPFLDVDIRTEREGGALWLRLTGREGTKQFIHGDFAPWFHK